MDLSQYGLNGANSNGTSNPLTIPGLEGIQGMLGTITTVSIVLSGLFIVLYLINSLQRMRTNRAIITMHKDIAAIKEILEHQTTAQQPTPTPKISATPAPTTPNEQ